MLFQYTDDSYAIGPFDMDEQQKNQALLSSITLFPAMNGIDKLL
jgi:hypothetical protein